VVPSGTPASTITVLPNSLARKTLKSKQLAGNPCLSPLVVLRCVDVVLPTRTLNEVSMYIPLRFVMYAWGTPKSFKLFQTNDLGTMSYAAFRSSNPAKVCNDSAALASTVALVTPNCDNV
jgi:hypothetical protein